MSSAVSAASSTTDRSAVPPATMTMPGSRGPGLRFREMQRASGVICHAGHAGGHGDVGLRPRAGDQHAVGPLRQPFGDGDDLFGGFALSQHDFRHAVSQRTVVVDLGEADVLVGQEAQPFIRSRRVDVAGGDVLQELTNAGWLHLWPPFLPADYTAPARPAVRGRG